MQQPSFYIQSERAAEAQQNAMGQNQYANALSGLYGSLSGQIGTGLSQAGYVGYQSASGYMTQTMPEPEILEAEYVDPTKTEWSIEGELKRLTPGKSDI